ncbi:PIN domain-containing protein [Metallosphaera javensis (ex Sakai et al. 2022)]|uniref:PIN domain-containing protein n=1 Tax=Metallosphaera javensis (ex Sakai et al. 2022) TaxID=2775498 RepID=UPI0025845BF4|nr:MAG: PIN domain nuclease [Metallosphaera javensis (ex Sakai et al. 2022)]
MREKISLDSGFFSVYFSGLNEKSKEIMEGIYSGEYEAYLLTMNLGEFLDSYRRIHGLTYTEVKLNLILDSPIKIVPLSQEIVREAIKLREKYRTLSLSYSYLLASSMELGSRVVTTNQEILKVRQDSILLTPYV